MADAGARWVRLDLDWRSGEPVQGAWNMSYLGQVDTCVNAARAAGLNVLMVVGVTPGHGRCVDLTARWQDGPRKAQYYASALAFLAGHFKGRMLGLGSLERAERPHVLDQHSPRLRRDPEADVSGDQEGRPAGAGDQRRHGAQRPWLVRTSLRARNQRQLRRTRHLHPYEASGASSTALSGFRRLGAIHELMLSYSNKRPIWLTEFSWLHGADTNDAQQAAYLRRSVSCLPFMPYIKMVLLVPELLGKPRHRRRIRHARPRPAAARAAFHAFERMADFPGKTMLSPTTAARLCRPRLSAASPVVLRR